MAGVTRPLGSTLLATALLVVGLLGCAGGPAGARGGALRVATWNVENLFDELPPGETRAAEDVERKLERVGAALRQLDPDVVALQEVENDSILARLVEGPLAGRDYRRCIVDGTDQREVAVLARIPLTACRARPEPTWLFTRPPLEVHLEVQGRTVVVLAVHLKSKVGVDTHLVREQQARRLRAIADEVRTAYPSAIVVVAGDLNDLPESAPLAPLLADGAWEDLGAALPPGDAWTYLYRGRRERIDYLLVARGAAAAADAVVVGGLATDASDHRPVVADVVLR
jgi:endonuclease/exonuclease/phosphatase family metal-dependent hydrolase